MDTCLFVTNRWPAPLSDFRSGTALRMRLMMRGVQAANFRVHLLCAYTGTAPSRDEVSRLQADFNALWGIDLCGLDVVAARPQFTSKGLLKDVLAPAVDPKRLPGIIGANQPQHRQFFAQVLARVRPSMLFAHRLSSMTLALQSGAQLPPVVFDLDDIETQAFARNIRKPPHWRSKPLLHLQRPGLAWLQRRALRAAARTLVCSDEDAQLLMRCHPGCAVVSVPNAVPAPALSPVPKMQTVLFLGSFTYEPNIDAANHLIECIWPQVHAQLPAARLLIAGRQIELLRSYGSPPPGVEFLGFVDDLDELYARTRVVACPILSGAGTRVKIIEAALAGRPIVSSTLGAEGLRLCPDRGEIIFCDNAAAFAARLIYLLQDHQACIQLAENARASAIEQYDVDGVVRKLSQVIDLASRNGTGSSHARD